VKEEGRMPPTLSAKKERAARGKAMEQVMDMLMMTTLKDHEPSESPIVVLPCGHAFTVETLDGVMFMDTFYTHAPDGGWLGLVLLDDIPNAALPKPTCPHSGCDKRLTKVHRYGRVLAAIDVRDAQRKFIVKQLRQVQFTASHSTKTASHNARTESHTTLNAFCFRQVFF
jgi:hypothetical protein